MRYKDHVRFEGADANLYKPLTLEMIGWLVHVDEECVRVVSERYAEPRASGNARVRSTGTVIIKSTILELKRLTNHRAAGE